jgi:hypothetical protein
MHYDYPCPKKPTIEQSMHATNFALLFFTWIGHAMQLTFWFHLFFFSMCLLCTVRTSLALLEPGVLCQCPNRLSDPASRADNNSMQIHGSVSEAGSDQSSCLGSV